MIEENIGIYRNWKLSWVNSTFHSQLLRLALLLMSISASKSCYLIMFIDCCYFCGDQSSWACVFFSFLPNAPFFMDPIQEKKIDIMREHVITVFWDNTFLEAFTIVRLKKNKNPIGQTHWLWACCKIHPKTGLKIATDTVAIAADIFSLRLKILVVSPLWRPDFFMI